MGSGAWRSTMLAFEFLVLTAARSCEVRNARCEQIDRDGAVWTIPAERMKAGREHRVLRSPRALEVLNCAAEFFDGQGLFGHGHAKCEGDAPAPLSVRLIEGSDNAGGLGCHPDDSVRFWFPIGLLEAPSGGCAPQIQTGSSRLSVCPLELGAPA